MNTTKLLSIIIPAYNVTPYIGKCLDSCLNQDIPHEHYEIIVVDDGSKDDTALVVKQYCNEYPNISYHYQENAGQGVARNVGLSYATGEYIWFVDSDDWIKERCIKSLLDYAHKFELDICLFPASKICDGGEYVKDDFAQCEERAYSLEEFASFGRITYSPCNYITRRSMLVNNNILFIEGIFHEDAEFNTRLFLNATHIGRFGAFGSLYYYLFNRSMSTMNNKDIDHINKRIYSIFEVLISIKKTILLANGAYKECLIKTYNDIYKHLLLPLFYEYPSREASKFYNQCMRKYDFDFINQQNTPLSMKLLSLCRHSLPLTKTVSRVLDFFFRIKKSINS